MIASARSHSPREGRMSGWWGVNIPPHAQASGHDGHPSLSAWTPTDPQDIFPKLGDMGLLGVTVPEKHGGLGLGYLQHTIAMEGVS
jgi:alkylation response protein AidB-like acyl-CoA dehydrogenase